jgi:molybdopterin/thiamine biosynthesis adenylyltransferase
VRLSKPIAEVTKGSPEKTRQLSYFAHIQTLYPNHALEELAAKSALIIGVGGVGSHVALSLAGSGLGHLFLDDPDMVDRSNLNRQILFTQADIGKRKVSVAAKALKARFSWLRVDTITTNTGSTKHARLPSTSAIVVCGEREQIWDNPSLVADTPFLMAGYFGRVAAVGPCVDPANGGTCWACLMRYSDRDGIAKADSRRVERRIAWNPSGATVNAMTGSLAAEAVLRLLAPSLGTPLLINERLEIDMSTLEVSRIRLNPGRMPGKPCFCRRSR